MYIYVQILGLEKPWGVKEVKLDVAEQRMGLWLAHGDSSWECPECGETCTLYDAPPEGKWPAYIKATHASLGGAGEKILFDRFHVMKQLTEAVDMVRKQEHAILRKQGDDRLKKTKSMWLFSCENLPERYEESFEDLRESEQRTARAWHIKDWYAWAIRSELEPIKKAARKLQRHVTGIVDYRRVPCTHAVAEGLNGTIMAVKRMVGGFRNTENFKAAIDFYCGGLDLYLR